MSSPVRMPHRSRSPAIICQRWEHPGSHPSARPGVLMRSRCHEQAKGEPDAVDPGRSAAVDLRANRRLPQIGSAAGTNSRRESCLSDALELRHGDLVLALFSPEELKQLATQFTELVSSHRLSSVNPARNRPDTCQSERLSRGNITWSLPGRLAWTGVRWAQHSCSSAERVATAT